MKLNLTPEENTILQVKYQSKPIGKMNDSELSKWSKGLLVKIHVITGWVIPDDELMNILIDQFQKKLKESYFNVNVDEIEYAFRTYGTTVKDWGKSMNLALIDEVMIPYLESRAQVSKFEEHKKPLQIEHKEDLSDKAMEEWFGEIRERIKNGMGYSFIPVMLYAWLDKRGEIKMDTKTKIGYMDAAAKEISPNGEPAEFEKVKALAQKMVVNDYILKN